MQFVRLKGVSQGKNGTLYQMVRVASDGSTEADEAAEDYLDFAELGSVPAAPGANSVRLYAQDNGSGKTRIVARFATGADVVLATQA